jgi:hypothetical protein
MSGEDGDMSLVSGAAVTLSVRRAAEMAVKGRLKCMFDG